ncbi:BTB/POZ domain-containing protein POB1 [Amborella trichopoda]|uniref:BTB/POZ domain-containing protein POB1 n=1 Tax=Amborella trichopoda TaxID=13333 RepID=UPI0005D37172|nr:BTB/POZ domain-containing protein POB1 [Amborella trichopoda]XP_020517867.1 BTB/POZ domain-containing protein POB1 [Amborella trichopoda]|eukprot:XP_011629409.1 BTB/POZ domain-containing protein POB1 [Amborella trichopoda]
MAESANSGAGSNIESPGFKFAFDNVNFSDRILKLELMAEPCTKGLGPFFDNRFSIVAFGGYLLHCLCRGEVADDDDEVADDDVSTWSKDCSTVLRVKKLHINSAILALKSPFFHKLFSNGMHESDQRDVKLRISASEEDAFMELLKFMYCGMLSTSATPALLRDLLVVADKFGVASCVCHCCALLGSLPMTQDCALQYLEQPYIMIDGIRPLVVAAKQYLAKTYQDLFVFHDELMALPLSGIEAVLSSDELHVGLEDAVFDFALEWAHANYPNLEERREMLGSHIFPAIRFSHMSTHKLKVVFKCEDIDPSLALKLVARAFFVKAEEAELKHCGTDCTYKRPPLKVIQLVGNHAKCLAFLDLQREECAALFPTGYMKSQLFYLNGNAFYLRVRCIKSEGSSSHSFGLYLGMEDVSDSVVTQYMFASRSKPNKKFKTTPMMKYTFDKGNTCGYGVANLFNTPWTSFIADDSPHFLNGLLHLRAEVTIMTQ